MREEFSYYGALTFFGRPREGSGFFIKYLLAFVLVAACITVGELFLLRLLLPQFSMLYFTVAANPAIIFSSFGMFAQVVGGFLIYAAFHLFIWAIFESARQRYFIREEPFSLKIGMDEVRLFWVGVSLSVIIIICAFVISVVVSAVGAFGIKHPAATHWMAPYILTGLVGFLLMIPLVKLCAASSQTIRDQQYRFFDSVSATNGRFWRLFFAFVTMFIGLFFVAIVVGLASFGISVLLLGGSDRETVGQAFVLGTASVNAWPGYLILLVIENALAASFLFAFSGIAAHATLTDPELTGSDYAKV